MRTFDELYAIAVDRKGKEALEDRLPHPADEATLRAQPDRDYLASMTQMVFSAGFVWKVIRAKWPGFEQAFHGFDPSTVAELSAAEIEALKSDTRIVRNGQKIMATIANAQFVVETAEEHGSFGDFLASWPADDPIGLWDVLKKKGKRLGGDSGPRFLRHMGFDTFILTTDVLVCLVREGVLSTHRGTSKTAQKAAQAAFVTWRAQSGRSLSQISVVAACTVDHQQP